MKECIVSVMITRTGDPEPEWALVYVTSRGTTAMTKYNSLEDAVAGLQSREKEYSNR